MVYIVVFELVVISQMWFLNIGNVVNIGNIKYVLDFEDII